MALDEPAVKGGLAISGIYDLEPIRLCYLNDKLDLDEDEARRMSPLRHLQKSSSPLILAYWQQTSLPNCSASPKNLRRRARAPDSPGRLVRLAGCNHFTILEELANPEGALTALVRELAGV